MYVEVGITAWGVLPRSGCSIQLKFLERGIPALELLLVLLVLVWGV